MKLSTIFIITVYIITSLHAFCNDRIVYGNINKEQYEQATHWYLSGEYDKCIALAKVAKGDNRYSLLTMAYGALSVQAKKVSLIPIDREEECYSAIWAETAIDYLDEAIKKEKIDELSTPQEVADFFDMIDIAKECAGIASDRMYNYDKENKYDKLGRKYIEIAYKKTFNIRNTWDSFPVIQLFILNNAADYFIAKDKSSKRFDSVFISEYWNSIDRIVTLSDKDFDSGQSAIIVARVLLKSLSQSLINLYVLQDKEKTYPVLDFLLKTQDFTLYINGAKQYRDFKNVTWKRIQSILKDGEYAMIHFEGPLREGMMYHTYDSNSRIRNYTFLFNKDMTEPVLWVRGLRDQIERKHFNTFKKNYPDMTKLYVTGTDFMMFKDIIRTENFAYRLHSLSELPLSTSEEFSKVLMIADIDFNQASIDENRDSVKGVIRNKKLNRIAGDKTIINVVKSLFDNKAIILSDKDARRDSLYSYLSKARIIHISSHGIFDEKTLSALNDDNFLGGFTGKNILNSCRIALSGYNDNNSQCISASEIKELDLSHIDLVFLDACETGAGKSASGGTYSLAEAFHMAGVKNIIANLDPIHETIAVKFAEAFYKKVKAGESYHDAFYEAKKLICPSQRIVLWE